MSRQRKTLVAALFVLLLTDAAALWAQAAATSALQWQTSLEEAKRLAAQTNRLVLVHFWSPSCPPCLQLEQNVFSQPQVQQAIQARFVPIKLNADDWPTTVKTYGVTRLPTDLVITSGGQVVGRMLSPPTPDVYLAQLNIAASGTGPAAAPPAAAYAANSTAAPGAVAYGANAPAATAPVQPAIAAYSDSRYTEFYQRFGNGAAQTPAANNLAVTPNYQTAPNPYSPPLNVTVPQASIAPSAAQQTVQPSWGAQPQSPVMGMAPPVAAPSTVPPLGLEGYSPVALVDGQRWQLGDRRFGAIHRGRTYLFATPEEQQQFLANPDRYSPALSGIDPVVALDYGKEVEGKRQFGVQYEGRVYLLSNEASRRAFAQNSKRYAAEVLQAENAARTTLR